MPIRAALRPHWGDIASSLSSTVWVDKRWYIHTVHTHLSLTEKFPIEEQKEKCGVQKIMPFGIIHARELKGYL